MPGIAIGNSIVFNKGGGINWTTWWASIVSATVEDAAPTNIVLTFPTAQSSLGATDFTVTVNGANSAVSSATWAGAVLTLVIATTVVYGDVVVVTLVRTGGTVNVTNNTFSISALSVLTTSDTEQTLTATIKGTGYDGVSFEYSTDNITFTEKGTSATGTYNATGLTPNTLYYWRARLYKGANYGSYSDFDSAKTSFVLLSDQFTGATINSSKWVETDPGSLISQNGSLIMACPHTGSVTEFTNKLQSVKSIASGVAVAQGNLTWTTDSTQEALGGIYLYKDNNNFACISSRNADGSQGRLRLRVTTGGVSRYSFYTAVAKAQDVKIWTDGTDIKFYYWNVNTWTQLGTTQTFSLGYGLYLLFSFIDAATFTGANPINIDNAYFSILDYSTRYPALNGILDLTGHCWFTRNKAIFNAVANKAWVGQVHNDGSGYSQHIVTIDNDTGVATTVEVGSVVQFDDHNEPSILVRASDSRLFIAYAEHSINSNVKFRVSTNPLDASAWEAEGFFDVADDSTYASCFQSATGNIYIFYRGTTNGWGYIKSTNGGASFAGKTLFVSETGDRPYLTIAQSPTNSNIIHFVMSMGHPQTSTNPTPIGAFYFDCSTDKFYKLDGTEITASIPFDNISDITLVMDNVEPDTGWVEDIIVDSTGKPRYLLTFHPNGQNDANINKDLYYAEWTGSAITTPYKIHDALDRNITGDAGQSAYPSNSCFDRSNPDVIIASKNVSGVCEIFKITRVAANNFTSEQITFNSMVDQWRPFTIVSDRKNVFWLNKADYTTYTSFSESLVNATIK